jgi:hypothetical protein
MALNTQKIGPFFGVDNRLPDDALRVGGHYRDPGNYLHDAVNVEVDNAGALRRRRGEVCILELPGAHSLCLPVEEAGVVVAESTLYLVTGLPSPALTVIRALESDAPMSYALAGSDLYYSNGTDSGRLPGLEDFPMALPTPDAPIVSAIAGSLPPGKYRVWAAYWNETTGEEGGLSPATQIDLDSGGLSADLPGATPGATHVRVYLSGPDGAVPRLAATVAPGALTVELTSPATGHEGAERYEAPLPPGELCLINGRLCSYRGAVLYVGEPFRYGYYRPMNYIPFPAPIAIVAGNQGGTYVVADKTYWIPGDVGNVEGALTVALPYGGVPGTAFEVPDKPLVGWFGQSGVVIGDPAGAVEALTAEHVDAGPLPGRGVAAVFTGRGYDCVVSCGWCVNLENKAATRVAGWDVTSASRGYGTKADGLYRLGVAGTGALPWSVDFGKLDFKAEALKRMTCVYLGLTSDDQVWLRVETPRQGAYEYPTRRYDETLQIQRVDVGRGFSGNWFQLGLFGEADFALASVSFVPAASTRRI